MSGVQVVVDQILQQPREQQAGLCAPVGGRDATFEQAPLAEFVLQFEAAGVGVAVGQCVNGMDRDVPQCPLRDLGPDFFGNRLVVGQVEDRLVGPPRRVFDQGRGLATAGDGVDLDDRSICLDRRALLLGQVQRGRGLRQGLAFRPGSAQGRSSLGAGRDHERVPAIPEMAPALARRNRTGGLRSPFVQHIHRGQGTALATQAQTVG